MRYFLNKGLKKGLPKTLEMQCLDTIKIMLCSGTIATKGSDTYTAAKCPLSKVAET